MINYEAWHNMEREFVKGKLLQLNGELLKNPYKNMWTPENPTLGYCYIVSEALYHYCEGEVKAFCISLGESGTHWYVTIDGTLTDFTAEQFEEPVDYTKGVGKGFFKGSIKTGKGFISKRGYEMANHLGLVSQ